MVLNKNFFNFFFINFDNSLEEMLKIYYIRTFFELIFVIFILSACKEDQQDEQPYADYIFKGVVKNAVTSEPVPGIMVSIQNFGNKNIITAEDGIYNFSFYKAAITTEWYFRFEDTDSSQYGFYETKDTLIRINPGFFHDYDGEWYYGRLESDIIIFIKKKN